MGHLILNGGALMSLYLAAVCQCTIPLLRMKCGECLYALKTDYVNSYFLKKDYKTMKIFLIIKAAFKNVNCSMQVSMFHLTTLCCFPFQDM